MVTDIDRSLYVGVGGGLLAAAGHDVHFDRDMVPVERPVHHDVVPL